MKNCETESMKILLIAINAKYIHSNPAVYSLRAYAGERLAPYIEITEYTINNKREEILADIFARKPDVAAFSCYIWNWSMISSIITELPKVMPKVHIWLGGPEVTYNADELMEKYPMVDGIMVGEGEETFAELAKHYCAEADSRIENADLVRMLNEDTDYKELNKIAGIVYRTRTRTWNNIGAEKGRKDAPISEREEIFHTPSRAPLDISKLPFLYQNISAFENRIIYYESSRGCPYRCSYCLSSIDKTVRLRDMETVKKELRFFLNSRVKQVKFTDRTFNCNREHAKEIWKYIAEHDNGVTNFHFEIAAELLSEEELEILAGMRAGLVQLEIGVQSANPKTLNEIRRISDIDRLRHAVSRIIKNRNIHVHLDLIAGLPYEDYDSFINSFNTVYAMKPHQLQLGFLKVLKGSYMHEKVSEYCIQYSDEPPYEVLSTKWLPYEKTCILKQVEEMVERYYNSNQFTYTMPVLQSIFPDAYTLYKNIADYYREKGYRVMTPSRIHRYQILLDYIMDTELSEHEEAIRQVLTFDLYLRENIKSRPGFAKDLMPYRQRIRDFYKKDESRFYFPDYADCDIGKIIGLTHVEVFDYPVWEDDAALRIKKTESPVMILFDYGHRNPLTYEAKYTICTIKILNC